MSTTRATARTRLLQALGFAHLVGRTPSANGVSGGTTTVDTTLGNVYHGDDFFNGYWEIVPLGPAGVTSYAAKQVSDFAGGDGAGTLTHGAFAAQVTTAATYELSPYDPALLHNALNEAARILFPDHAIPKVDETLMVDNLLTNWDFETYAASAFTDWTKVGTPTTYEQDATIKMHSANAAKIVAAAGAAGQATQAPTINIKEITTKTATLRAWVHATAADVARIRLDWDGTNFENHDYHSANDEWELQEVVKNVSSTATQVKAIMEVAVSGTARFDAAFLGIDHIYRYTIPSAIIKGPYRLSVQRNLYEPVGIYDPVRAWHEEHDSAGRYIVLDAPLTPGHILRLDGYGLLSSLSTDTGTTELDDPMVDLWVTQAALLLVEEHFIPANPNETKQEVIARLEKKLSRLLNQPGMTFRRHGVPFNPHSGIIGEHDGITFKETS